jgi:DNA polymerase III subunit epsilon
VAAARLAWRLARVYPAEVGQASLAHLHQQQIIWSQKWATQLTQYWRSRGQSKTVDGSWPIRQYTTEITDATPE